MKTFAKTLTCVLVVGSMAGCGLSAEAPAVGEEPVTALEQDFGGPDGLMEFFMTAREDQIRGVLSEYGIGYVVHQDANAKGALAAPSESENIADCPQYFPSSDRNRWHNFNGEQYYIDGSGRPRYAYSYLPPIVSEPGGTSCQTSIGQWGDAEKPSNDYDGGHMIGSQLGGWGKRANIVPQDLNFNRGNWAQLENKVALCRVLPGGRIRYYISVGYPNGSALIPSTFGMQITNQSSGASVSLSFTNTDYGGSNGTAERNRGVSFLTNQGCN